ncbi:hypothetical protein CONPUDRAFT_160332 [Coniophora puteana RWD-64-598 SS2]|uniref:EngC GTPase domain-containing protein n=1 Tax=Coniophora puteana (strain RWD-64-598) TaxID=741705 RepID=R7SDP9_CONPW|nr:uncharacterized protein CONPUDRAFT_160332 [Coniophora puteana RWD-64-598 SS2]EIW74293.1 hypothetical protein CONPUDRAFT_160332 [Coniophora puteana RWD-64-598 SS2]
MPPSMEVPLPSTLSLYSRALANLDFPDDDLQLKFEDFEWSDRKALHEFRTLVDHVKYLINRVEEVGAEKGWMGQIDEIMTGIDGLLTNRTVVVVGNAGDGKSTLLNSLLGSQVLATGSNLFPHLSGQKVTDQLSADLLLSHSSIADLVGTTKIFTAELPEQLEKEVVASFLIQSPM